MLSGRFFFREQGNEEQAPADTIGVGAFPRGRKSEGLRNMAKEVGTGHDSWRTNTMGLGGGPQGSNLFPQAGRLSFSWKVSSEKIGA